MRQVRVVGESVRVEVHAMRLDLAPAGWESALELVAPRWARLASGRAPERSRLGEYGAGLLAARVLGVSRDEDLIVGDEGKLTLAAAGPEFNISHDDGLAVLAVATSGHGAVGVDVEDVPAAYGEPQNAALRAVLSAAQLAEVESAADPALACALAWTRVEAVLKADGRGFAFRTRGGRLPDGWAVAQDVLEPVGGARHALAVAAGEKPEVLVAWHDMGETIRWLAGR